MHLNVAYLVNQYPKVSHSFIRREILAVEARGIQVLRFSIRSYKDELVDPSDIEELEKTRVVLAHGLPGLLPGLVGATAQHPATFLNGLRLAWTLGQTSERGILYHLVYLVEACVLLGWFEASKVAHVHVHFGTNAATVAMLCQALGGPPYSFTVHGPKEFDNVHAIALPEKIKWAKFVIAISSFSKSQLYRWTSFENWSKIHIIPCGVDKDFLVQELSLIPCEPQFTCIGQLSAQKGHLLLLEATRRLAAEGRLFKVNFVGDGELRPQLEQLIERYDLQSYVEITGWASSTEVKFHLLRSRVLVLPSFAEGLPVVIMKSLALGRPVISTYIAGIPELVESGVNGWLVTPGSVKSLVSAMRSALSCSTKDFNYLGRRGRKRVAQYHNANHEAKGLVKPFQSSISTQIKERQQCIENKIECTSDRVKSSII